MFKQDFVRKCVLLNVVLQNHFFSRVIFEVFLKTFIANNLLFKLKDFFVSNSLVAERLKNLVDSSFHFGNLVPQYRQAFEHVSSRESLRHFLGVGLKHAVFLLLVWSNQIDHSSFFKLNLSAALLVTLVSVREFEIDHETQFLENRCFTIVAVI